MREHDRSPGDQGSRGRLNWRSEIRARLEPLRLAPERGTEIVEEVAQHIDDRFGGRRGVYLVAIAALALVVAAACAIPVLRAMRVQPVDVLRAD